MDNTGTFEICEQILQRELSYDDIAELEQIGALRALRTRDFRIDSCSTSGNARPDLDDPKRKTRVEAHRRRIQSELGIAN